MGNRNPRARMKSAALCDFDSAHSTFATFCCKIWFHCAQIELNSWSVTSPPPTSAPQDPSCHDSICIAPSLFSVAVSFCPGIFLLVAFWTEADIFNAPLLFFECGKLFVPQLVLALLLRPAPSVALPGPAFPRVKANEARDRTKRRPFCWRYFLPLRHSLSLFARFICACRQRKTGKLPSEFLSFECF